MSKEAKMFSDLLALSDKEFISLVKAYQKTPLLFDKDEYEVISAMFALIED